MNVFLVAVVNADPKRSRTWGWYENFEDAEKSVLNNCTDMFECGYYEYAVIEEMPEGVLAVVANEFWFQAVYYAGHVMEPKVERIQKPASFSGNFNFTLG